DYVRRDAAYALRKFGVRAGPALPKLKTLMSHSQIVVRDAALAAVAAIGQAAEVAIKDAKGPAAESAAKLKADAGKALLEVALTGEHTQMKNLAIGELSEHHPETWKENV